MPSAGLPWISGAMRNDAVDSSHESLKILIYTFYAGPRCTQCLQHHLM